MQWFNNLGRVAKIVFLLGGLVALYLCFFSAVVIMGRQTRPAPPPTATLIPLTPIPSAPPTITPTPTNSPTPEVIESDNPNIQIKLVSTGGGSTGSVRVQILLPANTGFDPKPYGFKVSEVVKDIGGEWNIVETIGKGRLGLDGTFQMSDIPPGHYTLDLYHEHGGAAIVGAGNVQVRGDDRLSPLHILFPVKAGNTTYTDVSLSLLRVGMLLEDGSAAHRYRVYLFCRNPWVGCRELLHYYDYYDYYKHGRCTGPDGCATFFISPGKYDLNFIEAKVYGCHRFNNISIGTMGKREIITIVLRASEADVTGPYRYSCD